MIKNIIFDLGNVLINGHANDVLDKLVINETDKKILNKVFFNEKINELDLNKMSIEEYYESVKNNIPLTIDKEIINKVIHYYEYRTNNLELISLIDFLASNYKIYILSNNNIDVYNYEKNKPIYKNVSGFIVSVDYGVAKPDLKIYEILLEKYNLKANECYFIDDKEENILAAKQIGMRGYIFNNNLENLKKDMEKNEIIIY